MSYIEDALFDAIFAVHTRSMFRNPDRERAFFSDPSGHNNVEITRDFRISSYRVDIMLSRFIGVGSGKRGPGVYLAVECDGHDFHERTKQQAAYDRSRDRELLISGIVTARFTGSEIVHSPERCAHQVWEILDVLYKTVVKPKVDLPVAWWPEPTIPGSGYVPDDGCCPF